MIIKSIPHKVRDFGRLIDYIDNEEKITSGELVYNFLSSDKEYIKEEFLSNSRLLSDRKGANYLYHDIISLEENNELNLKEQEKILLDLGNRYLKNRFNRCLAYGKIHKDRKHLHLHLCISSNRVGESKRVYYSKKDYLKIKQELEDYKIRQYQDLNEKIVYNKPYLKEGYTQKELEYKKRTHKPTRKEILRDRVNYIFESVESKQDLLLRLKNESLEIYERGQTVGIKDSLTGRKYRLKTLGVFEEYARMKNRLTKRESMSEKIEELRDKQEREKYTQKEDLKEKIPQIEEKLTHKEKLEELREKESIEEKEEIKEDIKQGEKLSQKDKLKALREKQEQNKQDLKYNLKQKFK